MRPDAVLVDVGQTLLHTREPVGRTYARVAAPYGGIDDEAEVWRRFKRAFAAPWEGLRYAGDGRPFWRRVVARATGTEHPAVFEALYAHYEDPAAWRIADDAREVLTQVRSAGVSTAVVSNWDLRLRPLLAALDLLDLFDVVVISAEVGAEKPDPAIVRAALDRLGIAAPAAVLVGDGDVDAACAAASGCGFWRYGVDVTGFSGVRDRLLGRPIASPLGPAHR